LAAEGVLQGNIDAEESARISADNALQGQIDTNDDDILALQNGLAAEITQRGLGDALNQNAISTLNAQLGLLDGEMHDSIASLTATDEYLESLINQIPGSVYEVESIVEANDHFDAVGNTVYLEEQYNALSMTSGQLIAQSGNFTGTLDAQNADIDYLEAQNAQITNNLTSPEANIDDLWAGDADVNDSLSVGGNATIAGTLNVAGETTLGANVSVTGDVTVSGNVTASDATASTHLASFGQLTTAADSLQENIEDVQADVDQNELDSDAADNTLQSNIDANMSADTAQASADAAARALIQQDVDGNEADSDTADNTLQSNIDAEAATRATADSTETAQRIAADNTLQSNIDANTTADTTQASADAAARALIQSDVDTNEADSDIADGLLNDRADSLATAVAGNDTDIQNLQDELDATQTGAGLNADGTYTANAGNDYTASATSLTGADDMLDAGLEAEVDRATAREDSIIDVLYWNLDGDELTLDAGITDLEIGNVDIHARLIQADGLTSETVTTEIITADEATLEEINTDDLTAQVGHIADLTWNHARALGSSSTTVLDGSLDVDGTTDLDTTRITEHFSFDGWNYSDTTLTGDMQIAADRIESYVNNSFTVAFNDIVLAAPGNPGNDEDSSDDDSDGGGDIYLDAANKVYLSASGDGEDASLTLDSTGIDLDSWFTLISDSLRVGGNADFDATLNVDGNATVGGTLAVTGTASAANAVADSDLITKGQSDTRDDSLATAIAANDADIVTLHGRADSLATQMAANDTEILALQGTSDSLVGAVASNDTDIVTL
ncbi:MAG: hypothetical protein HOH92_08635, partial [Crocinitomicaceae bacterium]|nr:hypothetical protein [Crocinitomicaceae bacterium]